MKALLHSLIFTLAMIPQFCFAQFGGFQAFYLPYGLPVGNYAILGDHLVLGGGNSVSFGNKVINQNLRLNVTTVLTMPWQVDRVFAGTNQIVILSTNRCDFAYLDPNTNQTWFSRLSDSFFGLYPIVRQSFPAVTDSSLSYFWENRSGVLKFAKYSRHTNSIKQFTVDSLPGATYNFSNSPNQLFYYRCHSDTTLFEVDLDGNTHQIGKTKFVVRINLNSGFNNLVRVDTTIWAQELREFDEPWLRLYRFDRSTQGFVSDTNGLQSQIGILRYQNNELTYLTHQGLFKRIGNSWVLSAPFIDTLAECYFEVAGTSFYIGGNPNNLHQKVGQSWNLHQFSSFLRPTVNIFHLNQRYLFIPDKYLTFDQGDHYFKINTPMIGEEELDIYSTSFYEDIWFARNQFNSYYSTDLGTTWTPVTVASTTRRLMAVNSRLGKSDSLLSVYYTAPQTTRLALSTDKGRTWRAKSFIGVPTWGGSTLFTVGSRIFLYNRDKIYRAENANSPFVTTFVDTLKNLKVIGRGDSIGIVADGYAASSVDGGITYVRATLPASGPFRSPTHHFGAYWVVQSNRLYRSLDQMQTWEQIWTPADSLPINIYNFQGVNQIGFSDSMLFVFGFGGSYRAKFNPDIVTGLDWQPLARPDGERLVVYPNPSSESQKITLKVPPTFIGQRIEVFNSTGQQVQTIIAPEPEQQLDLPKGIYMLKVQGTNDASVKVVVN